MATEVWNHDGVAITRYAGPENGDMPRQRYRITNMRNDSTVDLSVDQFFAMMVAAASNLHYPWSI